MDKEKLEGILSEIKRRIVRQQYFPLSDEPVLTFVSGDERSFMLIRCANKNIVIAYSDGKNTMLAASVEDWAAEVSRLHRQGHYKVGFNLCAWLMQNRAYAKIDV